jgi:hypothetical protein
MTTLLLSILLLNQVLLFVLYNKLKKENKRSKDLIDFSINEYYKKLSNYVDNVISERLDDIHDEIMNKTKIEINKNKTY